MKDVVLLTGAGQIGMAIARRIGHGKKIIVGDKRLENAEVVAKTMGDAGFDVVPVVCDISSRESILGLIAEGQRHGEISYLINGAGVSPSQAPVEAILKVDLYGTAVLLEEVGKVIRRGGAGVTISSQSGHRMEQLGAAAMLALRIFLALVCAYGAYASAARGVWKYLFLRQQFFFLDMGRGYVLFAVDYLAMLVLFAAAAHYAGRMTRTF